MAEEVEADQEVDLNQNLNQNLHKAPHLYLNILALVDLDLYKVRG